MREHRSAYEWQCDKCGKPIKPQTPYYLQKYYMIYKGERITAFKRIHVECPKGEDGL